MTIWHATWVSAPRLWKQKLMLWYNTFPLPQQFKLSWRLKYQPASGHICRSWNCCRLQWSLADSCNKWNGNRIYSYGCQLPNFLGERPWCQWHMGSMLSKQSSPQSSTHEFNSTLSVHLPLLGKQSNVTQFQSSRFPLSSGNPSQDYSLYLSSFSSP